MHKIKERDGKQKSEGEGGIEKRGRRERERRGGGEGRRESGAGGTGGRETCLLLCTSDRNLRPLVAEESHFSGPWSCSAGNAGHKRFSLPRKRLGAGPVLKSH